MENKLIITPKTKVAELLNAYPQLEEVLYGIAPEFKKLKNPVLRNTIAKIATLRQAAAIGNLRVDVLVNKLRKVAGQDNYEASDIKDLNYTSLQPEWFDKEKVVNSLDAIPMLEAGEHPVHQVMADLKALNDGEIFELKAPFLPAPLIEKAISLKYRHWVNQKSANEFLVYFTRGENE